MKNRNQFAYDAYICYSTSDKARVSVIAETLKARGLRVWLDHWEIKPGDDIYLSVEQGLEKTRTLIFCISKAALESDWVKLERSTAIFRDPSNASRRFIPILLEDCELPDAIGRYRRIDFRKNEEHSFEMLLSACSATDNSANEADNGYEGLHARQENSLEPVHTLYGHQDETKYKIGRIVRNVPPRIRNLIGREAALSSLHKLLNESSACTAITQTAIYGLGGIGKTTLASEYCHRYGEFYHGIWWASAEHKSTLTSNLILLANELHIRLELNVDERAPSFKPFDLNYERARAAIQKISENAEPWLLVYDNVENPNDILEFLPSGNAKLLITSRFADWYEIANELPIEILEIENAARFLMDRAQLDDLVGAKMLSSALGGLPLALEHAGAFIKRTPGLTFDTYLKQLHRYVEQAPRGSLYAQSVAATFRIAIDYLSDVDPDIGPLVNLLTFMDPDDIPIELLKVISTNEDENQQALRILTEFSLIKREQDRISTHRLVQLANRSRLTHQQGKDAIQRITSGIRRSLPPKVRDRTTERQYLRLKPQMIYISKISSEYSIELPNFPDCGIDVYSQLEYISRQQNEGAASERF